MAERIKWWKVYRVTSIFKSEVRLSLQILAIGRKQNRSRRRKFRQSEINFIRFIILIQFCWYKNMKICIKNINIVNK